MIKNAARSIPAPAVSATKKAPSAPHYDALVAAAIAAEMPRPVFVADLTKHDRAALERRSPTEAFGWVLAPTGTFLLYPSPQPIDGAGHFVWEIAETCEGCFPEAKWFWWDGRVLSEIGRVGAMVERLREASGR